MSLATATLLAQLRSPSASCSARSSSGRSAPAIRISPTSATASRLPSSAARCAASRRRRSRTSMQPSMPRRCGELPGPRTAARTLPSAPTSARSVFELPPSTARAIRGLIARSLPEPAMAQTMSRRRPGFPAAGRRSHIGRSAGERAALGGPGQGRGSPQPRPSAAHRQQRAGRAPEALAQAVVGEAVWARNDRCAPAARRRRRAPAQGRSTRCGYPPPGRHRCRRTASRSGRSPPRCSKPRRVATSTARTAASTRCCSTGCCAPSGASTAS